MPVYRHKIRVMYKIFNFTKKTFRNQSDNNYPIGMDKTPTILFGLDKKIGINHTIVNEQIFWKRDYRLIKKRRDHRPVQSF